MNIEVIRETIEELKNSDTSFDTCSKLASLYTVLSYMEEDVIVDELSDIFPAYQKYITAKRHYQTGDGSKETVIDNLNLVCKEIYDFIKTLYSCTDMPLERIKIQNMIEAVNTEINY